MLKAVCWGICICVCIQSIIGKSIEFNSGYRDLDDKSTHLQTDAQKNEKIKDDLSKELKFMCEYTRIPLDVKTDSYLKCIQHFLEEKRNMKLTKRSIEDDNTVPQVSGHTDIKNDTISHEVEEPTENQANAETIATRLSDELIVPAEIPAKNPSEIPTLLVSEVNSQEPATTKTSSDAVVVPIKIAVENSSENSSLPVNEITDTDIENGSISNGVSPKSDELVIIAEGPTEKQSNAEAIATTVRLSDEVIVPAEIPAENPSEMENSSLPINEIIGSNDTNEKTTSEMEEKPIQTTLANIAPKIFAAVHKPGNTNVPETTPLISIKNEASSDKPLANSNQLTQQTILKINDMKNLNSGETSDSTVSSLNLTTDTPVLFKNGFDDILKNTPGKQHNMSIKEGESSQDSLGSRQKQTVLFEVSKNNSSNTIQGDEISKAGESQEKTSSSPNNILLIVFAILGVVGTLAFAFNYIKKRREDREVNEMIKLEEEGRELKEIKPLMKSNFVQNGAKSLEYIDADPQLQVETETKNEKN